MQPENRIVVNGFELLEQVGEGGMGVVWRARHLGEGVDVALKFVTTEHADDAEYREGFRREVEAAAGLSHLGIVSVHDSGTVDELVSLASDGALPTGSPWLAMEFARFGNLANVVIDSWSELRVVLYDVLDALAHAHSRGVIHRDLKPANILAAEAADGELILKLSDFGIAHVSSRKGAREDHEVMGTPAYMAPEQLLGRSRDYGPWTDLYTLGCVAYEMASGRLPFSDGNVFAMLDAHLNKAPHPLEPRFDVPPGFALWVSRLLEKRPGRRFLHAADARFALSRLDPVEGDAGRSVRAGELVRNEETEALATASAQTLPLMLPADTIREVSVSATSLQVQRGGEDGAEAPPIPGTWREAGRVAPSRTLLSGVGLGLFGLRPVPFVGREAERDALWATLRRVQRQSRPRGVIVEGEAGCGKSRLVEWIGQRAAELGAARLLSATHDPMSGGNQPIRDMISRALRCDGLDREAAFERILRRLGGSARRREAAAVLTELCVPGEPESSDVPAIHFESAAERHAAVRRALELFALERPVLVWLDDVQWGADAMGMMLSALKADWDVPVLFVATARSESVEDRRREGSYFQQLLEHDRVNRLQLERLDPNERSEQIQRMLRLPDDVVDDVARRSEGNPLFAVQLVGDWVQRGVLRRTATGFELTDDATTVPDDIHSLWMRRYRDLKARFGQDGATALRVAAALGQEVDEHEWRRACETVQVFVPHDLLEALVSRRLARRVGEGRDFSFAHGMFRESIARDCRERGEWSRANDACAAALEILYPDSPLPIALRRAMHHLEARKPEKALGILLDSGRDGLDLEAINDVERALELAEQAIDDAELPDDDPRRGDYAVLWNRLRRKRGEFRISDPGARQLLDRARKHGWQRAEAEALWSLGTTVALNEDVTRGREMMFEAVRMFRKLTGENLRPHAMKFLSHVFGLQGDADRARSHGVEAHEMFRAQRNHGEMAWCLYYVALAERISGNPQETLRRLRDALERARDAGLRDLQANCLNVCGDAHRQLDELAEARNSYFAAMELWDTLGSKNVAFARFNLAMCELHIGRFDTAEDMFTPLVEIFESDMHKIPLAATHVALITCAAARGDASEMWEHIMAAHPLLEATQLVDPDLRFAEERALELVRDKGMTEFVATLEQMLEMQR